MLIFIVVVCVVVVVKTSSVKFQLKRFIQHFLFELFKINSKKTIYINNNKTVCFYNLKKKCFKNKIIVFSLYVCGPSSFVGESKIS